MNNDFAIFSENVVEIHQEDAQVDSKQENIFEFVRELAEIEEHLEQ